MRLHRISKGEMPPVGKYILIYVPDRPWRDSSDPKGVFWRVAMMVKGISLEERRKLENSDNPVDRERAKRFTSADEFSNNRRPYYFDTFGPDHYFGQEVDIWCELPVVNLEAPEVEVDEEMIYEVINILKKSLTGEV